MASAVAGLVLLGTAPSAQADGSDGADGVAGAAGTVTGGGGVAGGPGGDGTGALDPGGAGGRGGAGGAASGSAAVTTGGAGADGGEGGAGGSISPAPNTPFSNGATTGGGDGGAGGNGGAGGAAVTTAGDATAGSGGNGGDGGDGGSGVDGSGGSITNSGDLSGGAGADGGIGGAGGAAAAIGGDGTGGSGGDGGKGGDGGSGIAASGIAIVNSGDLTGGDGGSAGTAGAGGSGTATGGDGTGGSGGAGGDGGAGGAGISGSNLTIDNSGTISGGAGGSGSAGGVGGAASGGSASSGSNGSGGSTGSTGIGIAGSDLAVTNRGTINDGVSFTGGTNSLTLQAGSSITGNVVANGTADTLGLGGSVNSSFDVSQIGAAAQYRNFGLFSKTGSGTWTLTGTTGATTPWTIRDGTLEISADGALGDTSGGLALDGGTLEWASAFALSASRATTLGAGGGTFDTDGSDGTINGNLSGTGALTKAGAGTLTLTGTASHSGGTTISAGTLRVGAGGTTGSLSGNVANSGTLAFDRSDSLTFSGNVSGGGALTKAGAGTLTLAGTASHSGGTTISAGTLRVGAGGITGSLTGDVANSGTLAFDRSDDLTFAGIVSGNGALTKAGTGTLVLTGANSYSGGTTISGGTLRGSAASLTGDIVTNATLAFDQASDASFAGDISGTGSLTKLGAGTLSLTGAATYSGVTTIAGGKLLLAGGGSLPAGGALALEGDGSFDLGGQSLSLGGLSGSGGRGIALGGGSLTVVESGTASFGGAITGAGSLTKAGSGTLTLTGANSYSGGTTISAGTLQGSASSLAGDILNNAALAIDQASDASYAGAISGTGTLTKLGSGTLTMTGSSSFTGGTTVAAGGLVVNGTLGDLALLAGTTLGGSGTVGAVTAAGRVSPGNSIGTLSSGPVTFQAGSVYAVEIADDGTSDKLEVAGTATIEPGAAVEVTPEPGSYANGLSYTILSASGGIQGTFDSVAYAAGSTLTFDLSLVSEGNDLVLLLGRLQNSFAELVGDPALLGPGAGLDALEAANLADGERDDPLLQALFAIEATTALDTAVQQLSGAGIGGGAQTAQLGSQAVLQTALAAGDGGGRGGFAGQGAGLTQFALGDAGVTDVLSFQAAAPAERAEAREGSAVWLQGVGGFGSRDGEGLVAGQSRHYAGIAGGVGVELGDGVELGLALARVEGETGSDDGLVSGDGTTLMAAVTAGWQPQGVGLRLTAALGLARHDLASERRILFQGFDETASGDHVGWEALGDLGATWDIELGALTVSPTAGLGLSFLDEPSWSESGAGSANLAYDETETLSVLPRAGLGLAYDLQLGEGLRLTPSAQALWLGRLGDRRSQYDARFLGTDTSWAVPGLDEPAHSAAVSLGVDLASDEGWSLGAGYAGRFAEGAQDHGFLVGGSLRF